VSAPIPTIEPARIVAGDTAKWTRSLADYPASAGWVLTYKIVSSANRYTITCTASGDDHLATAAAATTVSWVAGAYAWRAQVALASEVYTVASGQVTIEPVYTAAVDARSQARRMLEAVETMLEGRTTSAVAEYTVGGRQLKYLAVPDLLALRDRLRIDVGREDDATRAAAGLAPRGRVFVRFGA
jgi:hypothetical protein